MSKHFRKELGKELGWVLNRNASIEAIDKLEKIAKRGVRFKLINVVENVGSDYFNPTDNDELFVAKMIARGWILALKKRFKKQRIWFGSINQSHQYGIRRTEREADYIYRRDLKRRRGVIQNILKLVEYGKKEGSLKK